LKIVQECRAFELLRGQADRVNYLVTKHAKIVAMTCTHAALKRREFLELGFKYDTLLMEESAQILEIETFIPMLLQNPQDGHNRLKRVRSLPHIMASCSHVLPPVATVHDRLFFVRSSWPHGEFHGLQIVNLFPGSLNKNRGHCWGSFLLPIALYACFDFCRRFLSCLSGSALRL
jgi:hypothetical protein